MLNSRLPRAIRLVEKAPTVATRVPKDSAVRAFSLLSYGQGQDYGYRGKNNAPAAKAQSLGAGAILAPSDDAVSAP